MKIILFEDQQVENLFPIAMTRHIGQIRWGISTIQKKWEHFFDEVVLSTSRSYLGLKSGNDGLMVNARLVPNDYLVRSIKALNDGEELVKDGQVLASNNGSNVAELNRIEFDGEVMLLQSLSDLFAGLGDLIRFDASICDYTAFSHQVPEGVVLVGDPSNIWIHSSAVVQPGSIINVKDGVVVIDDNSEIMEGTMIRGPFYLGKKSILKMGAKVYGPSVIGPECKVGGEISNVLFHGYSNKAHDGFLGNAVVGEWCNFGADSNCSNLKNNYSVVKQYSYLSKSEENTGLTFCGVVMGDHSKCGINTMFNTGTVVGVCANIFGGGFPEKHLPSFSWGGSESLEPYKLSKALETIKAVKMRRGMELSDTEVKMLTEIHAQYGYTK